MQPEETTRAGTVFAVGGALMVLAVVLGSFLLVSGGPERDQGSSLTEALSEAETPAPAAATPSAAASSAPEKRRCWDESDVEGKETCPVAVEEAQFWAFGLDRSDCRPGSASSHARWSYECTVRGVDVHLAVYNSVADRAERLSTYGAQQPTGGGRVIAGGPTTPAGRWLRAYDDTWAAKGLLMYASVDAEDPTEKAVLVSLRQRFPERILQGEPVLVD